MIACLLISINVCTEMMKTSWRKSRRTNKANNYLKRRNLERAFAARRQSLAPRMQLLYRNDSWIWFGLLIKHISIQRVWWVLLRCEREREGVNVIVSRFIAAWQDWEQNPMIVYTTTVVAISCSRGVHHSSPNAVCKYTRFHQKPESYFKSESTNPNQPIKTYFNDGHYKMEENPTTAKKVGAQIFSAFLSKVSSMENLAN